MRILLASVLAIASAAGVYAFAGARTSPAAASPPTAVASAAADTLGCERTDPPVSTDSADVFEDIRGNAVFACRLRKGDAPVRLVLRADPEHGNPLAVDVYGAVGTEPAQVLPVDDAAGQPPRGSRYLQGMDLNGDGWMDLKVLTKWGFTGNEGFDVFRYEPSARRFVPDSVLTGEGMVQPVAGRPCVETHWHMGIGVYSDGEYCWRQDRWVFVRLEYGDYLPREAGRTEPTHIHTVKELRDGEMRIVRVDTNAARH